MEGWVKLHRRFVNWEWVDEPNMVSLFIHLILRASNRDTKWKGQEIKRGQVIFGLKKWSIETGISIQTLRTCLEKLKSTGEINTQSTHKFTLITICNYNDYQKVERGSQHATNTPTNTQSTRNQQHREKVKKVKNKKKDYSEPNTLHLEEEDYDDLY